MDFIADRYPQYVPLFQSYSDPLERADAIRYFILYEFGGIYADLDMEFLKPLDSLLNQGYPYILGDEPYVQTWYL